jgi:hypothetical protein
MDASRGITIADNAFRAVKMVSTEASFPLTEGDRRAFARHLSRDMEYLLIVIAPQGRGGMESFDNGVVLAKRKNPVHPHLPYVVWDININNGVHSGTYDLDLCEALWKFTNKVAKL